MFVFVACLFGSSIEDPCFKCNTFGLHFHVDHSTRERGGVAVKFLARRRRVAVSNPTLAIV